MRGPRVIIDVAVIERGGGAVDGAHCDSRAGEGAMTGRPGNWPYGPYVVRQADDVVEVCMANGDRYYRT
jgi:hypothetical protein